MTSSRMSLGRCKRSFGAEPLHIAGLEGPVYILEGKWQGFINKYLSAWLHHHPWRSPSTGSRYDTLTRCGPVAPVILILCYKGKGTNA